MNKRFWEMAEHAYATVPLYMKREGGLKTDMPWEKIPVLTKEEILKDVDSFYSCLFLRADMKGEVLNDSTSGSSGKCMEIYWHKSDLKKSLLPAWFYRKKYYGINPGDRMCYFYTTSNVGIKDGIEYAEEEIGNRKGFSKNGLNQERMLEIYQQIIQFQAVWLFLQPSMAVLLCDAAQKIGKPIPTLKYVEFTGEMLTKEVKRRTEEVFGCKTANHYGCNEVYTVAFECPYGNMHITEKNVFVEIVDESFQPAEEGRVLLTSVANRIMPFVRYDIGDRGRIIKDVKCRCGCKSPVLEITKGRVHDSVMLEDGTKINAYVFVHAVEYLNRNFGNCIRQFQVIQKGYEDIAIKLAVDEEVYEMGVTNEMLEEGFVQNILQEELVNMNYEFEFYERLFSEEGKWLWFQREF